MIAGMFLMIVLSLLALAAHFLRAGHPILVLAVLVSLALLFVRRPWAGRTTQVVLLAGALEWIRTTLGLAMARIDAGEPYIRMIVILGAVVLLTLAAALTYQTGPMRRLYSLDRMEKDDS